MILYQIADQLLATSHMPGNKIQIQNIRGDHPFNCYMDYLYGFTLVLPVAAHSQLYKSIERERLASWVMKDQCSSYIVNFVLKSS